MLSAILRFEVRYWMRAPMVWVFFAIVLALAGSALSSDRIHVQDGLNNIYKNSPYEIENWYANTAPLTLLMMVAFVNSAAARDFALNTYQIIFTTPIRRWDFLFGRYLGASIVSLVPMVAVSAAIFIFKYMPWVEAHRWGPVRWDAHAWGLIVFAIPNTLFMAAIIFAVAALTRSTVTSFLAGLFLLAGYIASGVLRSNLENETLAMLVDPFGARTFALMTKYWTVWDRNNSTLGLTGFMLWNRLLWLAVGFATFLTAGSRFRFSERSRKTIAAAPQSVSALPLFIPAANLAFGWRAQLAQFYGAARIEFFGLVKSVSFVVIVTAALLVCVPAIVFTATEGYGNSTYPVTYWILHIIQQSMYPFLMAMITYYAGVLIWNERDARMDEIHDALPHPNWIGFASKLTGLIGMVFIILAFAMATGIAVQTWHGYHRYQLGLYVSELFFIDGSRALLFTVLAFFIHVLSPNKYVGYFVFIAYTIASSLVWPALNVQTKLVDYAARPAILHSDFFGRGPYWQSWGSFTAYWMLLAMLLSILSVYLWRRGKESSLTARLRRAIRKNMVPVYAVSLGWLAAGGWIFYNTNVLNHSEYGEEWRLHQADYEKTYKELATAAQPRITALKYTIDLDPERRALLMKTDSTIVNKSGEPIPELYFTLGQAYDQEISVDGAKRKFWDERLLFTAFEFSPPMEPGASRVVHITTRTRDRGFQNEAPNLQIAENGTFFSTRILPQIGYQDSLELTDFDDRTRYGLSARDPGRALERNCVKNCMNSYIDGHSDWVSVESVMSTSPDQIAIAPGSLIKEWQANGRRYFQYKLDHDSLNFYSFQSARYNVLREDWNGVKVEVYYHPEHAWNVPKMARSIRKSLEYCSANFGAYPHKEARIIEFPRVAGFAQAYPGTMPYSESIGFIANLTHPDDIDMVYYVVAHEIAHQWWGHQVAAADVEGATLLSETMAEYSALMVMEREYGRDMMRKFLKFEMDAYLTGRGRDEWPENPLMRVSQLQNYIYYRKGAVELYLLKEMIGEEAINRALRNMVERFAYRDPPYPTSYDLVDLLDAETPKQYKYLLQDIFEDIRLFSNRTLAASATRRADGRYDVSIDVESYKVKADGRGRASPATLDDWIDIGAFAKPENGKKYGKTLYRERIRMTSHRETFRFVVAELPEKAGIDPFLLLVDLAPGDNTKEVTVH